MTDPIHPASGDLERVISSEEIARVHGHANFGDMTPREVVNDGVRKYAIGYHSGHTQLCILLEHGLITQPRPGKYGANLTKKGKAYARAVYQLDQSRLRPAGQTPCSRRAHEEPVNGYEMPEVAMARYIETLRADEGDSVTICCDDPEATTREKQVAIDCRASWTDWNEQRFYGESVLQCLAKAVQARAIILDARDGG